MGRTLATKCDGSELAAPLTGALRITALQDTGAPHAWIGRANPMLGVVEHDRLRRRAASAFRESR